MSLIIAHTEPTAHWYRRDGTPVHQVPTADGNGMRNTTVADARKGEGLLPSVTGIIGVIAKPALISWLQQNAILSALTLPRNPNESMEDFAKRVVADSSEQVSKAADLGTLVHAAIENYLVAGILPTNPTILGLFEPAKVWLDENVAEVIHAERRVVNLKEGYAGTMDIEAMMKAGHPAVIDVKTQGLKQGKKATLKANFYIEWLIQGVAYMKASPSRPERFISLVVNSNEPSPCQAKFWEPEDYEKAWQAFLGAFSIWKFQRNYDPSQP